MDKIELYQGRLRLEDARFEKIEHDDAIVAEVYRVTKAGGEQLILKICARSGDYMREVEFLRYFAGKLPVPRIRDVVPPEEKVEGAVLMECLPGALLKMEELVGGVAYELGSLLARIHVHSADGYGDLTDQKGLSKDPRAYFTRKYDEGFDECSGHLPKELLEKCRKFYESQLYLLETVDGPCLIHRDFRPGNVIAKDGKIQGLIDWASGRASFAEEDFCFMEHGEVSMAGAGKESFLAGYASVRPVPRYEVIMPLLRVCKALATVGFTVRQGTWEGSNARIYRYNRQYLEGTL